MTIPRPLVQTNRAFIVTSVILGFLVSPVILLIPVIFGILSLGFNFNPVMRIARNFLKKPSRDYKQEDREDQRFNQWLSTGMLALAVSGFYTGLPVLGYIFGIMVGLAASVALMGFCVGCYIRFQYNQWKFRREHFAQEQQGSSD